MDKIPHLYQPRLRLLTTPHKATTKQSVMEPRHNRDTREGSQTAYTAFESDTQETMMHLHRYIP